MKNNFKSLTILTTLIILTSLTTAFSGGGSGTSADPYQISTCSELQEMQDDLSAHYELANDIDCSGYSGFSSVGDAGNRFTGSLDGQNFTVDNLTINEPSSNDVGLIGNMLASGQVKDIGLKNVDVDSGGFRTGGLVGTNGGSVSGSFTTGTVNSSEDFVGGLVGINYGTVSYSFSTASVDGNNAVGGLVGENRNSVSSSFSTGSVSNSYFNGGGGLVGGDESGAGVSNGYWDNESSGKSSSAGGTGLTTSEMEGEACQMTGFSQSNWNFFSSDYPDLDGFSSGGVSRSCNQPPSASFSSNTPVLAGEDFGLDASGSSDPDGDGLTYEWDTDDDGSYDDTTGVSPAVSKSDNGGYSIGLRVKDGNGGSDTVSQSVNVDNRDPSADFSFSPSNPVIEESIDFDASSSSDVDGSIESFEWDFNGSVDTGETASYTFSDPGNKNVELNVTDDDGASNTVVKTVTVGDVVVLDLDWSGYSSVVDPTGFNVYYGVNEIDENNVKEVGGSEDGTQIFSEDWVSEDYVCVEVRPFNSAGEAEGAEDCVTIE